MKEKLIFTCCLIPTRGNTAPPPSPLLPPPQVLELFSGCDCLNYSSPLVCLSALWVIEFGSIQLTYFNPLMPNDAYSGRTSKCCILYIYSTNIGTEYFKHGIYSPFFSLQNAVSFIILTYLVSVLFTFYIQSVLKFKKIIPAPKG